MHLLVFINKYTQLLFNKCSYFAFQKSFVMLKNIGGTFSDFEILILNSIKVMYTRIY